MFIIVTSHFVEPINPKQVGVSESFIGGLRRQMAHRIKLAVSAKFLGAQAPLKIFLGEKKKNKNQFFSVKLHHLPSVLSKCQIPCLKYASFWRVTMLGLVGDHPKDGR